MPLPVSWTQIAVSWDLLTILGAPVNGRVVFRPAITAVQVDATTTVLPDYIVANVVNGVMDPVSLASTDDPNISPVGWAWMVRAEVPNAPPPFLINVPSLGGPIDLSNPALWINPPPVPPGDFVQTSSVGVPGGVAQLDGSGVVPLTQLPASVKGYDFDGGATVLSGGIVSVNVNPAKFDITACTCAFVDETVPSAPVVTIATFPAQTAVTLTGLGTTPATFVGYRVDGTLVQQSATFTPTERRTIAQIVGISHTNFTSITSFGHQTASGRAPTSQMHDLMNAIGPFNLTGNIYSAGGANLTLARTSGTLFRFGGNWANNVNDPHMVTLSAPVTPIAFSYVTPTGVAFTPITNVDPNQFWNGAALAAVPSNRYTVQPVILLPSGFQVIVYGTTLYATLTDALNGASAGEFSIPALTEANGVIRAFLIVRGATTNLQNIADAKIVTASKFASGGGGVGSAGHTFAGQVKVDYTGLSLTNFTATVNQTFAIASGIPTVATAPTTTWPFGSGTSYNPDFFDTTNTRLRENNRQGQGHVWRVIGTYSGKTSGNVGLLEIDLFNPDSGFVVTDGFPMIAGVTSGTFILEVVSIADPASLDPGRGYRLRVRSSFTDAGLTVGIGSITRLSLATENG